MGNTELSGGTAGGAAPRKKCQVGCKMTDPYTTTSSGIYGAA